MAEGANAESASIYFACREHGVLRSLNGVVALRRACRELVAKLDFRMEVRPDAPCRRRPEA